MAGSFVGAGEQLELSVQGDGAHGALDRVDVQFDAAVVEEPVEALSIATPSCLFINLYEERQYF